MCVFTLASDGEKFAVPGMQESASCTFAFEILPPFLVKCFRTHFGDTLVQPVVCALKMTVSEGK